MIARTGGEALADRQIAVLVDRLAFPACPRWHDGRLWFADTHDGKVWVTTKLAKTELVCEVPGQPSGLGWLPDGTMIILSMTDRRLLRLEGSALIDVVDLAPLIPFNANDMAIDGHGRAYIGNYGFDLDGGGEPASTVMVCVEPDGEAWVVVEDLLFPNGSTISADGLTLIVAESFGQRLSAYDINDDGSLAAPRIWADLRPNVPAGICVDVEGGVWVGDPVNKGVMRVLENGLVTEWIPTGENGAYAVALGDPDGRTLYICTAASSNPKRTVNARAGRIEATRVDVPGPTADRARGPLAGS
jgi:sugar lactone lactonase YvrE